MWHGFILFKIGFSFGVIAKEICRSSIGSNSLEAVFEYVATSKKPPEFCDESSVFLTCLMELCLAASADDHDLLLNVIHQRLVLGRGDDGQPLPNREAINLLFWIPPNDWGDRVLSTSLAFEGNCVSIHDGYMWQHEDVESPLSDRIRKFVEQSRKMYPFKRPPWLPASVIILAVSNTAVLSRRNFGEPRSSVRLTPLNHKPPRAIRRRRRLPDPFSRRPCITCRGDHSRPPIVPIRSHGLRGVKGFAGSD